MTVENISWLIFTKECYRPSGFEPAISWSPVGRASTDDRYMYTYIYTSKYRWYVKVLRARFSACKYTMYLLIIHGNKWNITNVSFSFPFQSVFASSQSNNQFSTFYKLKSLCFIVELRFERGLLWKKKKKKHTQKTHTQSPKCKAESHHIINEALPGFFFFFFFFFFWGGGGGRGRTGGRSGGWTEERGHLFQGNKGTNV